MTPAEILERARRAEAEIMRRNFAAFARGAWSSIVIAPLEWSWHHETICRHLQYQIDEWRYRRCHPSTPGYMQRLAINVCPGSAKSTITSVLLNAWVWLRTPEWRAIHVSSADAVVKRDHDMLRTLVTSDWYLRTFRPSWGITRDGDAVGLKNSAGGQRLSRTFLSGSIGLRADAVIMDDVDDPKEVYSPAYRTARDAKWRLLWSNRVNDPRCSTFTSVQQVTHPLGFTATLIPADRPSIWSHLVIPLHWRRGLPQTPIGSGDPRTEVGEVMHPARFTPEVIEALKLEYGPTRGFMHQFEQQTESPTARYFPAAAWRFFQRGELAHYPALARPEGCAQHPAVQLAQRSVLRLGRPAIVDDLERVVISVDASFGANKTNEISGDATSSRVGLLVVGATSARRPVLDDRTAHYEYPDLKRAVKRLLADYPETSALLIEEKANGAALIQELRRDPEISVEIVAISPTEAKLQRAIAHQPAIEAGAVELLDGAAWLEEWVAEWTAYTGRDGDRDDRIDALTQAFQYLAGDGAPWWMR